MRVCSWVLWTIVALSAARACGQDAATSAAGEKTPKVERPVQMRLYPAAEPQPSLRYQLLPPFVECRPGNAAVWWNRLPAGRTTFWQDFDNSWNSLDQWMKIPLGDPQEKACRNSQSMKKALDRLYHTSGVFADMERAARFESCDWELPIREANYFEMLLPEVQFCRQYARFLAARAHLQIAEGRYEEAVHTLQVGFAEARDVAAGHTLINSLVGITIAGMMSHEIQQMMQQPDAPNLYWALSAMPSQLVDFRRAAEAEANSLYLQFPQLRNLASQKYSAAEWDRLLHTILKFVQGGLYVAGQPAKPEKLDAAIAKLKDEGYPKARQFLIAQGRSAAEVDAMPASQAILCYSMHIWDQANQDELKWFLLPSEEIGDGLDAAEQRMRSVYYAEEIIPLVRTFTPCVSAARKAEVRYQWNVAMLRTFEAMRLYAANHSGQWPERLSDIREVPVPNNPFDNRPFVYRREGDKVILTSEKGPRGVPWKHELTLMPAKR
ncbi:MAG: hypothetical protein ABFC63_07540 [Thermoguttaceae bacterium]